MTTAGLDVLMVTHRRPVYTRRALGALLETAEADLRVWVWQNGMDAATWDVVQSFATHPNLYRVHRSTENQYLRAPANWLLGEAAGAFIGFVNDDCIVAPGWSRTLRDLHRMNPQLGVLACWHFAEEDFDRALATPKIRVIEGGTEIMANPWVQGSGILLKRACVERVGTLRPKERGMTPYCLRIARAGFLNGWPLPLIPIEHMDDPRTPHTALRRDEDLLRDPSLCVQLREITTINDLVEHFRRSACAIQVAPSDPRVHFGVRKKLYRMWTRLSGRSLIYGRAA